MFINILAEIQKITPYLLAAGILLAAVGSIYKLFQINKRRNKHQPKGSDQQKSQNSRSDLEEASRIFHHLE